MAITEDTSLPIHSTPSKPVLPAPHPSHWTLRFKHHKLTLLLTLDPTTPFPQIKSTLLSALKNTASFSTLNGQPLPSSPEDIEFGVPIDPADLSQGWMGLEITGGDREDEEDDAGGVMKREREAQGKKGKGRPSRKRASAGGGGVLNANPMGAGLRDGGAVAFRFKGEDDSEGWDVLVPAYEDEVGEELKDEEEDEE